MKTSGVLNIHIAVFLFGFAGLFAKFISQPPIIIVFGRVFFAMIFLSIILICRNQSFKLENKHDLFALILLGALLAFHWWAFFASIQLSTVAIGLITFSTFPIFVTFLEPLLFRERLLLSNLLLSIIAFTGVFLVIPDFEIKNNITRGAIWGILSGFSFAILSLLNRRYVKKYSSTLIAFYQDISAAIVLVPLLILNTPKITGTDLLLLSILGTVFTGAAHALFIKGLARVKAQKASIIANLEPIYGIMAAMLFFGEIPSQRVITGGIIILGSALYVSIRKT